MWLIYWADHLFPFVHFYQYGVMPGELASLKGILLMPLIHSKNGFEHILNNSLPTVVLLAAIIYYYRKIAFKVFIISWLATGAGVWLFALNHNSFHIGMSGVIYAMAGFLFTSGVIRKYLPLQAISLFVAFIYGSMIWGVFPTESHVSWEGHLSGMVVGVILAVVFRKKGPQSPKYIYEIEQEMGIEPPDLEGIWREKVAQAKLQEKQRAEMQQEMQRRIEAQKELQRQQAEDAKHNEGKLNVSRQGDQPSNASHPIRIVYQYKPKEKPSDDTDQE
jgi:membrane associated rhomboid family serine protease